MQRASLAVLFSLFVACGGSGGGGDSSGTDGGGGGGGSDAGGGGGGCTNAQQCDDDQVCNTDTGECEAGGPCEEHSDCGAGAHCLDGTCVANDTGGTCDDDINCPAGSSCIDGFCGCEGEAFAAMPVVPNMMIVLDKSGSMEEDLDGSCPLLVDGGPDDGECDYPPHASGSDPNPSFSAPDKWTVATDAMSAVLTSHGPDVRFGLVTFANGSNCGTGTVRVDIGPTTETEIQSTIAATSPIGSTPIGNTLNALVGNNGLDDTDRTNYVLLVTDGQDTCSGNPSSAAQNLFEQTPSVKTFVVGFGGGVDAGELNDTAEEGGTARPGPTKYYQADNAAELQAALDTILGSVLSCQFQLDQVPEDLADLYVYADGTQVDRDQTQSEGWDYDAGSGTLTFYGQVCQDLQDGTITDLNIVYGCPDPDVE
jgi:hypothetical protein